MENQMEALGPTGARVGRRLNEIRRERALTLAELANKLKELGRPILLSALSKIEKGQRRVDVDDLVALALALDVSPNMILFPEDATPSVIAQLTPLDARDAESVWSWALRDQPAQHPDLNTDFFVSHAGPDQAWATWIAWQLEEAGYTVFLADWDFRPGEHFVAKLHQAFRSARFTIVVLSESYLASSSAQAELSAALALSLDPGRSRLLPVRVEEVQLPPVLALRIYVDLVGLSEPEARDRLVRAVSASRGRGKPSVGPAFPLEG